MRRLTSGYQILPWYYGQVPFLRHPTRHVQSALSSKLRDALTADGWFTAPPWGLPRVCRNTPDGQVYDIQVGRVLPEERDRMEGNFVALSLGACSGDEEYELGGGLVRRTHECWIDVIATTDAGMVALTDDLMDVVVGRRGRPFLDLKDYSNGMPLSNWQAELVDFSVERPTAAETKRFWAVIGGNIVVLCPSDGTYTP